MACTLVLHLLLVTHDAPINPIVVQSVGRSSTFHERVHSSLQAVIDPTEQWIYLRYLKCAPTRHRRRDDRIRDAAS